MRDTLSLHRCPCTTTETECVVPSSDGNIVTDSEEASLCISLRSCLLRWSWFSLLSCLGSTSCFSSFFVSYFFLPASTSYIGFLCPPHTSINCNCFPVWKPNCEWQFLFSEPFFFNKTQRTHIQSGSEKTNQPKFCLTTLWKCCQRPSARSLAEILRYRFLYHLLLPSHHPAHHLFPRSWWVIGDFWQEVTLCVVSSLVMLWRSVFVYNLHKSP